MLFNLIFEKHLDKTNAMDVEAYSATPNISLMTKELSFEQNSGICQKIKERKFNMLMEKDNSN